MALYFDEFEEGRVYRHPLSRTVCLPDSMEFACMIMDPDPNFLDAHWAACHGRNKRIEIHPMYVLSVALGIPVKDLTLGTTLGNLSMEDLVFPNPVFPGDTIYSRTTVLSKRASRTKPDRGIVEFRHQGFNQDDVLVVEYLRRGMLLRRPQPGDRPADRSDADVV